MAQYTPNTWTTGDTITKTKLDRLEAGAAAAQPAADPVSADKVTDGTTNKAYTAAEKTKLAGVATGATALPTQTGNGGKFLTTDGTTSSWGTPAGGAAVSDATTSAKGIVQLAGDLAGTAAAPTVAKIGGVTPATVATTGAYTDLTGKPTIPTVGAAGAGAAVALSSTDASVTNSRTPTAHAATHASGGSDPVTPAAIGAAAFPVGGTDGQAVVKAGSTTAWQTVSSSGPPVPTRTVLTASTTTAPVGVVNDSLLDITLDANLTLTLSASPAGSSYVAVTMRVTQDATGGRTLTINGSDWGSLGAPTLSAATKRDYITAISIDGTNWDCMLVGKAF